MSRKIGTDLDLVRFAVMNAKANPVSADPAGLGAGDEGLFWTNTTAHKFKFWNGSAAIDFTDLANSTGTLTASRISDFDTQVRTSRLDQMAIPTADLNLNAKKLTNIADGIANTDAASYGQLLALLNAQSYKKVRVATTANVTTLAGGAPNTLDGVTLVAGDRILVKDQTTASANGIYSVTTLGTGSNGTWSRASDADLAAEMPPGTVITVEEGTNNGDKMFMLTTNGPITLGTTSLSFSTYGAGGGSVTAVVGGAGLTGTGTTTVTLDVGAGTSGTITVGTDVIDVNTARVPIKRTGIIPTVTGTVDGITVTISGSQVTFNHAQNNPAPEVTIRAGSSPAAGYTAGEVVDMTDVTVDANNVKITLPAAPSANNWVFMVVA
jgi:hypothetical protein